MIQMQIFVLKKIFFLFLGSLMLFTPLLCEINTLLLFTIFGINYISYRSICNCFLLFDINLSRRSLVFVCHHIYPSNVILFSFYLLFIIIFLLFIINIFLLFDINLSRLSLVFVCHHIYPSNVPEQGEDSPWTISHAKTFRKKILFFLETKIGFRLFSYKQIFTLTFLTWTINI